ncbi:MAG: hypothetical protein NT138_07075 [Planctomycetales bacterium]|nr:hypothetical protein [Planctomycetales bacterium]
MADSDIEAFDDYWRIILRNEEYLRQWGHNARPTRELELHQDLEDAYTRVQPLLSSVTRQRLFPDLPFGHHPFAADNFHHALVKLLNPPENWFERVGVLTSPEYFAIKQGAVDEEKVICLGAIAVSGPTALVPEATVPTLDDLNTTQRKIVKALDPKVPRTWADVARRTKLEVNTVCKQSRFLQDAGMIQKVPKRRGFLRLIPLPGEVANMDSDVNP